MRLRDPTAWLEDLTIFVDDKEIAETAALLEPDVLFRGSHAAGVAWLSLVGITAGAFAAVTLGSGIRESAVIFAVYLGVALILFWGLRPATQRLLGRPIVWLAKTTFFWAMLLAGIAVLCAEFETQWLAYALSAGGGFFIGMMHGSLNPNCIKREDAWMLTALALGPLSTTVGTFIERSLGAAPGSIGAAATVGGIAPGLFTAPMSVLLFRLWDEAHGFRQMAMLFLHNDNFAAKAVACLDHAISLAPADAELYNLRGVAWSKMDEPERAAADWRRAAELQPQGPEPQMNRGVDYLRRGQIEQAIEALEAALSRDPENATIHSNLGTALERRGELDRAIAHFDRAIAVRSDYANAYSNRGYARFRKGDYHGAVADCDQALKLSPEFSAALVNRGHALGALGKYDAAVESYQGAIDMGLSPELEEEAWRALEALAKTASHEDA